MNNTTTPAPYVCHQRSLQGKPTMELFRNVFVPLLALSVFGNIANIIVYRHPYLRSSTTVRILSFKAIANMLSVVSMVPSFMYFYFYRSQDSESLGPFTNEENIPWFYWHSLKYAMFGSNWFSTIAVWLTVTVTLEHYMLVGFPMNAKRWSTMQNAHIITFCFTVLSAILHSLNLVAYETKASQCPNATLTNIDQASVKLQTYLFITNKNLTNLATYLRAYFWIHSISVQVLPMLLLVSLSWLIYNKLFRARKFTSSNNEQRQTVVRLALATTVCHIIFEMPHVLVMVLAAIFGEHQDAWPKQAEINAAAMFLGFTNASVTFIVYLGCSKKFRQIACVVLCARCCVSRVISDGELSSLKRSRNRRNTLGTYMTTNERHSSIVAEGVVVRPMVNEEAVELISMNKPLSSITQRSSDVEL